MTLVGMLMAALALCNLPCAIVSLHMHSFFSCEKCLEFGECLVGGGACVPKVTGHGENPSCFKHQGSEVLDDWICDWIITCSGNLFDFVQALPKCFNGVIWGPQCVDGCTIVFLFGTCDGAISCLEVHQHFCNGDIGKAKGVIIKSSKVQSVNCS